MLSSTSTCTTMSAPLMRVPARGCAALSLDGCSCAFTKSSPCCCNPFVLSVGPQGRSRRTCASTSLACASYAQRERFGSTHLLQRRCCLRTSRGRLQPRHARAQCRADHFDRMFEVSLLERF